MPIEGEAGVGYRMRAGFDLPQFKARRKVQLLYLDCGRGQQAGSAAAGLPVLGDRWTLAA